jgi:predicted Zn-ribbon and HTH transcriptional regulator
MKKLTCKDCGTEYELDEMINDKHYCDDCKFDHDNGF